AQPGAPGDARCRRGRRPQPIARHGARPMTTSTDPFDRTLSAWLSSLEADEPSEVTAWVVDRARTSRQRSAWLATTDLTAGFVLRPPVSGNTIRIIAVAAALAAAVSIGILAGGTRPRPFDVAPSPPPVVP